MFIHLLSAPLTMPLIYCISIASDEYLIATRPWPGGENKIGGRTSYHTDFEAIGAFLLLCAATGVSLLAVWRRLGATPRGQPWTPVVTLPHGRDRLSARRLAVWWTFREPSLPCHVHRACMRKAARNLSLIIPATACHQRHDVERYSRYKIA